MTSAPLQFSASRKITQPDGEAGAVTLPNPVDHVKPLDHPSPTSAWPRSASTGPPNVNSTRFSAGLPGYQRDPEKRPGRSSYPVHSTRPRHRWVWVWIYPPT
ncbi:hypothetical protein BC827DRAFT_1156658 [Russula dissimulans]|nr:hypothetical protein BC827DRAFT_1156658 [Russula dissimulans]